MLPRRIRAKIGAFVTATANMIWSNPRSSQTTIPIASRMPGIARRTSTIRMRTESTLPPNAPAIAPIVPPIVRAISTETTPTKRLIRAPNRIRLNRSWLCLSVPMM